MAGCGRIGIDATRVEMHVLIQTVNYSQTLTLPDKEPVTWPSEDTDAIMTELAEIDERVAEVQDDYADGTIDRAGRERILARLAKRREGIVTKLGKTVEPARAPRTWDQRLIDAGSVRDRWRERKLTDSEVAQIHDFVDAYMKRIVIKPVGKGGNKFDRRRVYMTPR